MDRRNIREEQKTREELLAGLRKLAFLSGEDAELVDGLDLSGVVELKRNANGTFEAKFVDKVRVLSMLRELLEERRDGALENFLDGLYQRPDGDET